MSTLKRLTAEAEKIRSRKEELDQKASALKSDAQELIRPLYPIANIRPITRKELFDAIQEELATGKFFPGRKVTLEMHSTCHGSARVDHYILSTQLPFAGVEFEFTDNDEIIITVKKWYDTDD
jgi:hypothetical protein